MTTATGLARRPDGTVATEHYAKLSRTHRSQFVLGGALAFIRSALRALSSRSDVRAGGTASPVPH